jgi:hypothetical protein
MLIVFAPGQGNGFSCQADFQTTMMMPEILEAVAAQIREDRKGIGQ